MGWLLGLVVLAVLGAIGAAYYKGGSGAKAKLRSEQLESGQELDDEASKNLHKPTTGTVANVVARWNARRRRLQDAATNGEAPKAPDPDDPGAK